jgi:hypothetical protein
MLLYARRLTARDSDALLTILTVPPDSAAGAAGDAVVEPAQASSHLYGLARHQLGSKLLQPRAASVVRKPSLRLLLREQRAPGHRQPLLPAVQYI